MAVQRTNGVTRALRKQSLNSLSLGLSLERLDRFLLHTLPHHANDSALVTVAATEYAHIMNRLGRVPVLVDEDIAKGCRDELGQIDEVLAAFISCPVTQLPPALVFEVHFLRGMIQDALRRSTLARQSYMKALWIATSATTDVPREQLVLTMHHLGKNYGADGNHEEAVELLEKVVMEYEKLKIPGGHPVLQDARLSIQLFEEQGAHRKMWASFSGNRRLSLIREEEESDRCLSV